MMLEDVGLFQGEKAVIGRQFETLQEACEYADLHRYRLVCAVGAEAYVVEPGGFSMLLFGVQVWRGGSGRVRPYRLECEVVVAEGMLSTQ